MADGITHRKYLNKGWIIILPLGIVVTSITFSLTPYWYLYGLFLYLNYFLARYIDCDSDHISYTMAESDLVNSLKKMNIVFGFFGAMFVGYGFLYSYLISLVGGHRSFFSHSVPVGTVGRIIFFNLPVAKWCWDFYNFGLQKWGWIISIGFYESTKMQIWLIPYLSMQLLAWCIGDIIHLILDQEWAKGLLYEPKKSG